LALALVAAACTNGDTVATTTGVAPTTTAVHVDVCTELKVAEFDLSAGVSDVFSIANLNALDEPDGLADEAIAEELSTLITDYYDTIDRLAATAPDDIRGDFAVVSNGIEPMREMLDELEPGTFDSALGGLDLSEFADAAVTDSVGRIESWTNLNCGVEVSIDPESVIGERMIAAAFSAFGPLIEGLGDEFAQGLAEGLAEGFGDLGDLGNLGDLGELGDTFDAVTLGDNEDLDALWGRCQTDDYAACDELYLASFNVYELFAVTCAGTVSFYAFETSCSEKHNGTAQTYGDDGYLDSLHDLCTDSDAHSCDQLFGSSPIGSEYEAYASSCGGLREPSTTPCQPFDNGEPFGYGDDPELDALWDSCSVGDATACDGLYFDSPFGSAYEAFGDNCQLLADRNDSCALIAELLGGPVG
jgi:hypothetical protein